MPVESAAPAAIAAVPGVVKIAEELQAAGLLPHEAVDRIRGVMMSATIMPGARDDGEGIRRVIDSFFMELARRSQDLKKAPH